MKKLAILDDYQNVAMDMADWTPLEGDVEIVVFNDHLSDEDDVAAFFTHFADGGQKSSHAGAGDEVHPLKVEYDAVYFLFEASVQ